MNTTLPRFRIGTLGNQDYPLSCSYLALQELALTTEIYQYPTFEEARNALFAKNINRIFVPSAHPIVATLIQDERLTTEAVFLRRIPPLVIASIHKNPIRLEDMFFYHPATESLVQSFIDKLSMTHPQCANRKTDQLSNFGIKVNSNVDACLKHLANEKLFAVTNMPCAIHFGLNVRVVLNHGVVMPWLLMKNESE